MIWRSHQGRGRQVDFAFLSGTPQRQVVDGKQQHLAAHLISIKTRIRLLSQHIANHNREISSLAETTELKQKIFIK